MARAPITNEILSIVRTKAHEKGLSLSEYGRRSGVSKAWLSKLKHTDANFSVETATNLLRAAGYDLKVVKRSSSQASTMVKKEVKSSQRSRLKKVIECQNT
jgi:transcriptional regulator with XRE-family HTH domain